MAEIVNSLFGIDPAALQQQRALTDQAAALQFAGLDDLQRAQYGIALGARGIGRGITQLLGGDEQLNKATQVRQLASQFDMTSPEGIGQFAQAVAPFAPDVAQQAAAEATRRKQQFLTAEKTQLDISRSEMSMAQETKLRDELSKLPADASDEQVIAIVSKYGSPDRILATLQSSQNRQAQMAQQRDIAQQRIDLQRESIGMRQGLAEEKRQERQEKQEQAANLAIGAADRVINEVKQARDKVSGFTAGAGALLSFVPLTEAKDLSKRLTTIKANLGFDRLQQMRDASPTGGALGQVAVQELIALQSTIASLDQDQSPAQLKEALDKIEFHYSNWRDTVRKSGKATPTGATPEAGKQGTAANPIVLK